MVVGKIGRYEIFWRTQGEGHNIFEGSQQIFYLRYDCQCYGTTVQWGGEGMKMFHPFKGQLGEHFIHAEDSHEHLFHHRTFQLAAHPSLPDKKKTFGFFPNIKKKRWC